LEITRSQNQSDIAEAETAVELAEIDIKKYLEGDYVKEKRTIEGNILIAQEEVKRAKERLEYSKRLHQKGYVSASEVESDQLALLRAQNDLEMAREELRVLEEYTKPRTEKELVSKRDEALRALERVKSQAKAKEAQAEADMLAKKVSYETELATLRKLEEQLKKCKLYAPIDGLVTYANEQSRWGRQELQIEEGAALREGQRIIRIPDLSAMQVNVKVHEAKVSHVKVGQPARLRVESMPDKVLHGTVRKVATMADAQSWFSTGVQVFTVIVSIDDKVEGLRPGMTAEVEILCEEYKDVLTVPVQSVIEREGMNFCYVKRGRRLELVPVELGPDNDKFVVVKKGLHEGDLVVQNVASALSEEDLKELKKWAARQPGKAKEKEWRARPAKTAKGKQRAAKPAEKKAAGRTGQKQGGKPAAPAPARPTAAASQQAAGAGRGGGRRRPAASGAELISRFDKNGNGSIERSEAPQFFQRFWSALDTDGDGRVSRAEADAAVKRMRQRRRQYGGR